MLRLLLVLVLIGTITVPVRATDDPVVHFGLTAVVVRENLRFFDRLAAYLQSKIDRPVEFVRTRSYQDMMDRLRAEELQFAWICGYPFVQKREPEFLSLLVVPIFQGRPQYRSYIIVHRDSRFDSLEDLKDRVFSFSDPNSNSGYLYPRFALLQRGYSPERFFRQTFFTYNHAETVEAVAERVADGGAVESYIWELLSRDRPEMTEKTRVVGRSPLFGFPPIVAHAAVPSALRARMAAALTDMPGDIEGRRLLSDLALDGFGEFPATLFDDIGVMARRLGRTRWASGKVGAIGGGG
jgi:phosphonate transport system substrate-binding protein